MAKSPPDDGAVQASGGTAGSVGEAADVSGEAVDSAGGPANPSGGAVYPLGDTAHPAGAGRGRVAIPGFGEGLLGRLVRRQEFAFAIVGGINTLMGIGLTVAWLAVLGDSVPPSVGVVAAYATGIGVAFVLHRKFVFRVHGRVVRDFVGFAVVNCGGLIANAILLELAVSWLGFPRTPAAVVVMGAVAAGTFVGHRYISFRRPVG